MNNTTTTNYTPNQSTERPTESLEESFLTDFYNSLERLEQLEQQNSQLVSTILNLEEERLGLSNSRSVNLDNARQSSNSTPSKEAIREHLSLANQLEATDRKLEEQRLQLEKGQEEQGSLREKTRKLYNEIVIPRSLSLVQKKELINRIRSCRDLDLREEILRDELAEYVRRKREKSALPEIQQAEVKQEVVITQPVETLGTETVLAQSGEDKSTEKDKEAVQPAEVKPDINQPKAAVAPEIEAKRVLAPANLSDRQIYYQIIKSPQITANDIYPVEQQLIKIRSKEDQAQAA